MKTPEWINEYAQDCRQLLGIGDEWRITITMTDKPNGSEGTGGSVSVDAEYLNAAVELNTSLLDDAGKMHQTITHEVKRFLYQFQNSFTQFGATYET